MQDTIDNHHFRLAVEEPLQFTPEEAEAVRKTQLYQNIEDSPVEVLLVLCSFAALGKNYRYARARIKERYKLLVTTTAWNFVRLREPYVSIIKRFKEILEVQLQYIPISSKQVRLKELQKALNDAKKIDDVATRTKSIVEVIRAAQQMVEGKNIRVTKTHTGGIDLYHQIVKQINQNNQGRRDALPAVLGERVNFSMKEETVYSNLQEER